ncbi:MAG: YfiR family protein, partial [Magnetococcales bacterium]|nr:YfiR family protein [Magnetococcales bacterium]
AYVFNILKFVAWPDVGDAPLTLCVLGKKPSIETLNRLSGRIIGNRSLEVRHIEATHQAANCHAVFLSTLVNGQLPATLKTLGHHHPLTISDLPQFAEVGGMVSLFEDDSYLRLGVNLGALKENGLSISSELLEIAAKVIP